MLSKQPSVEIDLLAEQAMKLSPNDRTDLAERLLFSVAATQPALHPSWGPELVRRVAELDAGAAELIEADEVFAETRGIINSHLLGR